MEFYCIVSVILRTGKIPIRSLVRTNYLEVRFVTGFTLVLKSGYHLSFSTHTLRTDITVVSLDFEGLMKETKGTRSKEAQSPSVLPTGVGPLHKWMCSLVFIIK